MPSRLLSFTKAVEIVLSILQPNQAVTGVDVTDKFIFSVGWDPVVRQLGIQTKYILCNQPNQVLDIAPPKYEAIYHS